jgi:hypothetical protein
VSVVKGWNLCWSLKVGISVGCLRLPSVSVVKGWHQCQLLKVGCQLLKVGISVGR